VLGLGPDNDVIFQYTNPAQGIDQTFGVNLKYYQGFIKREFNKLGKDLTKEEKTDMDKVTKMGYKTMPSLAMLKKNMQHQYS
jgi:hypothetical protein